MPLLSLKLGACFLQSVRRGGNWATVAVKHKLSLCSWGTLGVFPVEKNLSPDSYPRFIPDSYPDSYPSAAICSKSLLRSGQYYEAMPPKSSEDTKLKEKHCRNQLATFSQKFARRWVRKAYCNVSSATRYTTCERPTSLCAAAV